MTKFYNKDQIDQIGSSIGKKLSDLNRDLRIFIEESLPDAGGGTTTPAPAAGMFLDDGREVKVREVFVDIKVGSYSTVIPLDISANSIVSVTVMAVQMSAAEGKVASYITDPTQTSGWKFNYLIASSGDYLSSSITINHSPTPNYKKARGLITYLA